MELKELIEKGESNTLEFKESFRYNIKTNLNDKSLKDEVSKAVCGMLNSQGGLVLIGVTDDKTIKGIQRDLNLYGKGGKLNQIDKLLIDLNKHITDSVGVISKKLLNIKMVEIEANNLIKIEVQLSNEPVFHFEERFYFRDGPRTIQLSGNKMYDYISDRKETLNVRAPEEIFQEKLEVIIPEFKIWAQNKLKKNYSLEVNENPINGLINDYILGCIIPSTTSEDLINFESNFIKEYFNNYSILKKSQTYKTPDHTKQYVEPTGEEILIHPDGKVYFCQNYNYFNKEQPEFSLGRLENVVMSV